MRIRNDTLDRQAITTFAVEKVLTVTDLSEILACSVITVRRRLKEWDARTSYNKNGRYYTLRSISAFDRNGIWRYRDICFSKYGTLKNTVVALAARSKKGLNHAELQEILGLNPKCFMARFKELPGVRKERHGNHIVYFSSDPHVGEAQKRNRFPPQPSAAELPPDALAIIVLVELIHYPGMSVDELAAQLQQQGYAVEAGSIAALFRRYRIGKKKRNTRW